MNDFYRKHPNVKPPGGRLKYAIAEFAARRDEPRCIREAAAVTTVSGRYIDDLAKRYPWLNRELFTVLPFGAAERDFELARQFRLSRTISGSTTAWSTGSQWVAAGTTCGLPCMACSPDFDERSNFSLIASQGSAYTSRH